MIVEVDVSSIAASLEEVGGRAKDASPQMEVLATDIVREVSKQFESGGRGRFPALAPSTLKRKARLGKSAQPLLFNGGWKNSHEPSHGPTIAMTSTDRHYAIFHTSKEARTKIPLRDPYEFDQDFWDDATARILTFISTGEVT